MRTCLYFAVTCYNEYIYLTEKEITNGEHSRIIDLIDDSLSLQSELDWSEVDKIHRPEEVGCYQAVVEYRQTAEDDYSLVVISCTPVCII